MGRLAVIVSSLIVSVALSGNCAASYGIYVGRNLTADGHVYLAGSGDEVSSHWLEIVPAREHPPGSTISVGVDASAVIPGEFIDIPQVRRTARYLTMNYTEFEGFPPPLTNGGLNEHGVAARDIWSDSRRELVDMTPRPQRGPNYSDLARIVMERATSAEDAVRIVGELIERYGYSTYGGNSHLFADSEEGWVLIEYAGGQGLWIARRLGPDEIFMSYPGHIGVIPPDFRSHPDYRGSANFIDFAVEQGWYDPQGNAPFIADEIYGTDEIRYPRQEMVAELRAAAPISLRDILDAVRDPRVSKDATGYGQVAVLDASVHPELLTLWVAPTGSIAAPFLPWRLGVRSVPPEFAKHRYLSKDEARRFVTRDWQVREATRFAGRLFKRLMYYTCDRPAEFLPEVTRTLTAFENRLIAEQADVEAIATRLLKAGDHALAGRYLTGYMRDRADEALGIGASLLDGIETRTRIVYGLREPETDTMSRLDYQMVTCLPRD
jgi:hypothetical protein